ncbi:hypothetical protein JAAARDRAFT_32170 [Jaapia argillacea MUCL 33604]|uniref:Uncharacterized protein n=1 Tax=Jaapia argillacea MUCL 33604 TaxID=933084 RepID=A0A067Q268_9AGAM|nr:hypothetical protein JAAARDRAFT_32170 [Jaapia argillacea MUCL 33604]
MSVATPTLLPRSQIFPTLLPKPPQPHPLPLPAAGRSEGRLNSRRDLVREMDDLSEEEMQLEDITAAVKNRGFDFLVPIGKMTTQHEEKNDADDDDDDVGSGSGSESSESNARRSLIDDAEENDSGPDMDAELEDMDEPGADTTIDTEDADEMNEGDTEDFDDD